MKKVAKLVWVSVGTRVIVDKNASEEEIMEIAIPNLIRNLSNDGCMNYVDEILDDVEVPFGTLDTD